MGYQLEGDRYNFANLMTLYDKDICDLCDHDLFPRLNEKMQNPPIKVFIGCGHTFHQHCISQFVKEQQMQEDSKMQKSCPKCQNLKTNIRFKEVRE